MFLVVEKLGAAAGDEDDELLLVFRRLGGGAVAALLVPVVCSEPLVDIFERGGFGRGFEFQDYFCEQLLEPTLLQTHEHGLYLGQRRGARKTQPPPPFVGA